MNVCLDDQDKSKALEPTEPRFAFSFAFQPIVDTLTRTVSSYEALVRGPDGGPAAQVFSKIAKSDLHAFDRDCRVAAIAWAVRLNIACNLNLNLLPESLHSIKDAVLSTMEAASQNNLLLKRIMLEVTEGEVIANQARFTELVNEYRGMGLKVAIDDFGAGYSGLNLLAEFQPDQIKLDRALVRGIDSDGPRQAIVRALIQICGDLAIDLIAEGVENIAEYTWLSSEGVSLFQGYLFARPGFECLPVPTFPVAS